MHDKIVKKVGVNPTGFIAYFIGIALYAIPIDIAAIAAIKIFGA